MLGEHRESATVTSAGVPPPETTGTGMPARCEERQRRSKNSRVSGVAVRKRHQPLEVDPRQRIGLARQVEGRLGRLHAVAPEAGVALDEERHVAPGAPPASDSPRATTSLSSTTVRPWHARDQRHQPLGLGRAEDVVGERACRRPRPPSTNTSDLAELLAGDADRARRHLHLADGRDLVGLDVRAVADPWRSRCACTRRMLSSITSRCTVTAGVSRSVVSAVMEASWVAGRVVVCPAFPYTRTGPAPAGA